MDNPIIDKNNPSLLANMLKALRIKKFGPRSAAELGKKLGLKPAYYPKIESGELYRPSETIFKNLIEEYREPVDWATPLQVLYDLMKTGAINADPSWVAMAPFHYALKSVPQTRVVLDIGSDMPIGNVLDPTNRQIAGPILISSGKFIRDLSTTPRFPEQYYATNFHVSKRYSFHATFTHGIDATQYDGILVRYGTNLIHNCTASFVFLDTFHGTFSREIHTQMCLSRDAIKRTVDKYCSLKSSSEEGGLHMQETFNQKEPTSLD